MSRPIVALVPALVPALLLAACADTSELEAKLDAQENQIAALEEKLAKAPAAPARAGAPPNADDPAEKAAAELLKAATLASQRMENELASAKLAELKEKYPSSRAARAATRLEQELAIIGKPAGKLAVDHWFQGKVDGFDQGTTLVIFWELWCPHCKREVPNLTARYDKYKGKGLKMVGITKQSRKTEDAAIEAFLKEQKVNYPIARESGDVSSTFGVKGIPAAAVVKDGTIIWRGHPARLNDKLLDGWLN